jgi:anti-sigma-K factor RskA
VQPRRSTWRPLAVAAAVLIAVVGGFFAYNAMQARQLRDELVFTPANAPTTPAWRVQSDRDVRHLRLVALGGAMPQAGKSYELWAIAGTNAPVSAGVFSVDASGTGSLAVRPLPGVSTVNAFAVTLEPAGGLPAPSGEMYLLGKS